MSETPNPPQSPAPLPGDSLDRMGLGQRLRVDTSEQQPVYLLVCRNGSRLRLSASAYQLLHQVSLGRSFQELADAINAQPSQKGPPLSPEDIQAAHQKILDRIQAAEAKSEQPKGAFWLRRTLIPETQVARIAAHTQAAFHPLFALLSIPLIGLGIFLSFRHGLRADTTHFWTGYALFIVSLLIHEFGHASACARYGAKPSDIGFTFYLIYPAFYSNVSAAWSLLRWQRVMVDIGGVYFQLIAGAFFALAHSIHPWEPLRFACVLIGGSCLFSLNPILKFDGYWIVADALGITNLSQKPRRIAQHLWQKLQGKKPPPLPWPPWISLLLALYTVITFGFWIVFLRMLIPFLSTHLINYIPQLLHIAGQLWQTPPHLDIQALKKLGTSTYLLIFLGLMLYRLLSPPVLALGRRLRRARGN